MNRRQTGAVYDHPRHARVSLLFPLLVLITVGGGYLCTLDGRVAVTVGVVVLVLGGWAVSLCLHEFGHAAVAYRGGDTSVADKGYLTLDIRRYADLGLSLVLPLALLLLGGIPLPGGAVWINNRAIRARWARSLVSLAGPSVNLLLGVALVLVAIFVPMPVGLLIGLSYLALVQVLAFLLNMIPVPGLDGFGVIEPFLPERTRELAAKVRPWAPLAFFVVLVSLPGAGALFFGAGEALFAGIGGDPNAAASGYSAFMFWRH
jgi:Zn-dependent protease